MTTTIDRQIIIGALRLLDSPDKWCKGALTRIGPEGQSQFCIRGAMSEAASKLGLGNGPGDPYGDWYTHIKNADRLVAQAYNGDSIVYGHATYQNRPDTTFEQVQSLLQKALSI